MLRKGLPFVLPAALWTVSCYGMEKLSSSANQIVAYKGWPEPRSIDRYFGKLEYRVLQGAECEFLLKHHPHTGLHPSAVPYHEVTRMVEVQSIQRTDDDVPCLYAVLYYKGPEGREFVHGILTSLPSCQRPKSDDNDYCGVGFDMHYGNDFKSVLDQYYGVEDECSEGGSGQEDDE